MPSAQITAIITGANNLAKPNDWGDFIEDIYDNNKWYYKLKFSVQLSGYRFDDTNSFVLNMKEYANRLNDAEHHYMVKVREQSGASDSRDFGLSGSPNWRETTNQSNLSIYIHVVNITPSTPVTITIKSKNYEPSEAAGAGGGDNEARRIEWEAQRKKEQGDKFTFASKLIPQWLRKQFNFKIFSKKTDS